MIKPEALKSIETFLRERAAAIGVPDAFTVENLYPCSGVVDFDPDKITFDQADRLREELCDHPLVGHEQGSCLWMLQYCEYVDEEPDDDDNHRLIFDCSDRSQLVFTQDELTRFPVNQFLIDIKPEWRRGPKNVYLTLAYEYFDAIKAGTKTVEYRKYTENWVKRLLGPKVEKVTLQRGYGKGAEKMVVEVTGIELQEDDTNTRAKPGEEPPFFSPDWIIVHLGKILSAA